MKVYENYLRFAPAILTEWQQLADEGRPVDAFRADCERIAAAQWSPALEQEAFLLADAMAKECVASDYPYIEPSDLDGIRAARPDARITLPDTVPDEKRIRAAWEGRIAGCLLGKPVEGQRRETLYPLLKAAGNYPLNRYIRLADYTPAQYETLHIHPGRTWADTLDGYAPVDDDTNYTVLGLKILEDYGRGFSPANCMEAWTRYLPMCALCTAERVAYRNAALCMSPPDTATYRNPFREWIGAQIRADFFGYINPGDPETAAAYAWRDAGISHIKNGIYGEMWVAAMLAAAAATDDLEKILGAGLAEIPAQCRLAYDIARVRAWFAEGVPAETAIERIHEAYDEHTQHGWCHTNSNAMIVTMALLYGGGDFGRSVCLAVQAAFDTDCNGATVGSIIGMRNAAVPGEWTAPFARGLRTSLDGYPRVTVDELAAHTAAFVKK
ncbi:MAG: ADP-ribosylglycohydrolase family protein [Clostridiaceae bacterium]|nr:ADP-ribosylglycohydrolase family protein [Clostridiaceae bacterium]